MLTLSSQKLVFLFVISYVGEKKRNKMNKEIQNHDTIYEKLILILKVKFKTQLKGTEIYFKSFYLMKNIISNDEDFLLILNDKKSIRFSSNKEFYEEMIYLIKSNIDDLNLEFQQLQNSIQDDFTIDRNQIFLRHEDIGYCEVKLSKLLTKMEQLFDFENEKLYP